MTIDMQRQAMMQVNKGSIFMTRAVCPDYTIQLPGLMYERPPPWKTP